MNWTTDVPREPGWYWFKGQIGTEINDFKMMHLERTSDGALRPATFRGLFRDWSDLQAFNGHRAGPFGPQP
jgi:hypothetical protein